MYDLKVMFFEKNDKNDVHSTIHRRITFLSPGARGYFFFFMSINHESTTSTKN
jgi:hypothetical protein